MQRDDVGCFEHLVHLHSNEKIEVSAIYACSDVQQLNDRTEEASTVRLRGGVLTILLGTARLAYNIGQGIFWVPALKDGGV